MRQQFYVTYWRSQFSGQVSAIGARDEAIFTKNITLLLYRSINNKKYIINKNKNYEQRNQTLSNS